MDINIRPISWLKAARKEFDKFPKSSREHFFRALDLAAEGKKSDIAKPMKGIGSGVLEIALRHQTDAYRVVYTVQIGKEIWVIHAFQKKSTRGTVTPKKEMTLIRARVKLAEEHHAKNKKKMGLATGWILSHYFPYCRRQYYV